MRFKDKVVIVTGGGSGIGFCTAELFAHEGADVIIIGRNEDRLKKAVGLIKSKGDKADYIKADVSQEKEIEIMVSKVMDKFGKIDVLHNHAGILSPNDNSILNITEDTIMQTLMNNVKSQMLVGKHIANEMVKGKKGAIVNTASDLSFIAVPNACCYVTSKAAILGLTRSMAVDLASYNIRVNAVCPGFIYNTIMTEDMAKNVEGINDMKRSYLIPRLGQPKDVAPAVLHLASDEASFTTGSFLIIDGGHVIW